MRITVTIMLVVLSVAVLFVGMVAFPPVTVYDEMPAPFGTGQVWSSHTELNPVGALFGTVSLVLLCCAFWVSRELRSEAWSIVRSLLGLGSKENLHV